MKQLFKLQLHDSQFSATGKTVHNGLDGILPVPYALSIIQYDGDSGYYLFYLDKNGHEQTDTYHDDLAGAFRQAEFEFGVKESDWIKV